ncbi:MAG: GNAT family N-acetyltransferase, partial [Gemmataceae bacterium]
MVRFRTFRNDDPPQLVEIWNEVLTGRSAAPLRNATPLERHVFAKPYFDPAGLIVAVDENDKLVGFAHAGFGPNKKETALSLQAGVTSVILVMPSHQRKGIGSELLGRCEEYLIQKGARSVFAGPMWPLTPFYFGLYGGSDLPGFLVSDEGAAPFLEYHGYRPSNTYLVFQRSLEKPVSIPDGRFAALRRKYTVRVVPPSSVGTFWHEAVFGPVEPLEFRLEEIVTAKPVARALVWEMEGFSYRWGVPTAGILSVQTREDSRRQGLGKLLMTNVLNYLQEQYFGLVEVHAMESNQAAVGLFKSVG